MTRQRKKLYIFFHQEEFHHIAPLFVDAFPYRKGDYYVSRNVKRCRVRLSLVADLTTEQILYLEHGRCSGGPVNYYMMVDPDYNLYDHYAQSRRKTT